MTWRYKMENTDVLVIGGNAAGKSNYPDKEFLSEQDDPQFDFNCSNWNPSQVDGIPGGVSPDQSG